MPFILGQSFDLLNVHRLHTGIDNYGQGRNPFFLEPAVIIVVTDRDSAPLSTEPVEEVRGLFMRYYTNGLQCTVSV